MKKLLIGLMALTSISGFADCSINHKGFLINKDKVDGALKAKGYLVKENAQFSLQNAYYNEARGGIVNIMNVFQKNNSNRIYDSESSYSEIAGLFGKSKRTERRNIKSLPSCAEMVVDSGSNYCELTIKSSHKVKDLILESNISQKINSKKIVLLDTQSYSQCEQWAMGMKIKSNLSDISVSFKYKDRYEEQVSNLYLKQ